MSIRPTPSLTFELPTRRSELLADLEGCELAAREQLEALLSFVAAESPHRSRSELERGVLEQVLSLSGFLLRCVDGRRRLCELSRRASVLEGALPPAPQREAG